MVGAKWTSDWNAVSQKTIKRPREIFIQEFVSLFIDFPIESSTNHLKQTSFLWLNSRLSSGISASITASKAVLLSGIAKML